MGLYINENSKGQTLAANGKARALVADGAEILDQAPDKFEPNIICVVENGYFDAAIYCNTEDEFEYVKQSEPNDSRPYTWMRYAHAEELAK